MIEMKPVKMKVKSWSYQVSLVALLIHSNLIYLSRFSYYTIDRSTKGINFTFKLKWNKIQQLEIFSNTIVTVIFVNKYHLCCCRSWDVIYLFPLKYDTMMGNKSGTLKITDKLNLDMCVLWRSFATVCQ